MDGNRFGFRVRGRREVALLDQRGLQLLGVLGYYY